MGRRPDYHPTESDRETVRTRSGLGQPQEAICRALGISMATLHRHHKEDLIRGQENANVQVARSIFDMATGRRLQEDGTYTRVDPNPTMAIWWSKVRMRWQEPPKDTGETPIAINGPNATIIVKGGLPDPTSYREDDEREEHKSNGNGRGNGQDPSGLF